MASRVLSVLARDVEKDFKKLGKRGQRIMKKIDELIHYDNHPGQLPDGVFSAEAMFGKRLEINRGVYSLEVGSDRALAYIKEEGGVKVYAWFFAGSHQDYNKRINSNLLLGNKAVVLKKEQVINRIKEMKGETHRAGKGVGRRIKQQV